MKKSIKILGFSMLMLFAQGVYAGCPSMRVVTIPERGVSDGTAQTYGGLSYAEQYPTGAYWKQCYKSVEIYDFGGEAATDWTEVKTTVTQFQSDLLNALNASSTKRLSALNTGYSAMMQALNENYVALSKAKEQISLEMLESELEYTKVTQQKAYDEVNKGFFDNKVTMSQLSPKFSYFREMCRRNKMFDFMSDAINKNKRNLAIHQRSIADVIEYTSASSGVNQIANDRVQDNSSNYCDAVSISYGMCNDPSLVLCEADNVDSGVCKVENNEIFEMSNENTNAVNFLSPDGFDGKYTYEGEELEKPKNRLEDDLFDIDYTYTEEQQKAAEAFAQMITYQPAIKAPTSSEKDNPRSAEFIAAYNNYLAMINLANHSFENAIQARANLGIEGEMPMSERDLLRYIVHSIANPDSLIATQSGKKVSSEAMIYQLLTLRNKLDLEQFQQKERIESLLAALLSAQVNDPDLINKMNSLK